MDLRNWDWVAREEWTRGIGTGWLEKNGPEELGLLL